MVTLQKTGYDGVAVHSQRNFHSYLCKLAAIPRRGYNVVAFQAFRHFIRILKHDTYFLVGEIAIERHDGYPKGGYFSGAGHHDGILPFE